MFHPISFKRFIHASLGSAIVYFGLFLVSFHLSILANQSRQINEITNPNHTNYLSLSEFKKSNETCYSSNRTSGHRNVNDNYKLLISYTNQGYLIYIPLFLDICTFLVAGCASIHNWYTKSDVEALKSRLRTFSQTTSELTYPWFLFYLFFTSYSVFELLYYGYFLQYAIVCGYFFDLGIRFLLDPAYLSFLFPDWLWCYRRNEKDEELFSFIFKLRFNFAHGQVCLALWFTLAFFLLLNATLFVQIVALRYSRIYRFRRLKQFWPSVNEKLLRQLSKDDLDFSVALECLETTLNSRNFKEFLDDLVKSKHFEARVKRLEASTKGKDANALALVTVKS